MLRRALIARTRSKLGVCCRCDVCVSRGHLNWLGCYRGACYVPVCASASPVFPLVGYSAVVAAALQAALQIVQRLHSGFCGLWVV